MSATTSPEHVARISKPVSRIQHLAIQVHCATALGFVAGVIILVFFAGASLFVSGSYWDTHAWAGNLINLLPATLIVTSLVARLPWSTTILSCALFLLVGLQHVAIAVGDWVAALHPVNALVLVGLGMILFRRSRSPAWNSEE
jgi:hypothetical protein